MLDNYRTQKHPEVRAWLAGRENFHLHFTPTSASWMNQVACRCSILHRLAIQRGVFRSVRALMDAIRRFLDGWETRRHPFAWVKSPEQVLHRPKAISRSQY